MRIGMKIKRKKRNFQNFNYILLISKLVLSSHKMIYRMMNLKKKKILISLKLNSKMKLLNLKEKNIEEKCWVM
jgi:hypothetical protein